MRVALEQLASNLSRLSNENRVENFPKIILINGNEALLIEETLDQIREILKTVGFSERLKYQLESGFDWSQITGVGQAMSLFSERRIIELRVAKSLGAPGSKAIVEYCGNPPEDDILILIMPLLDYRQRQAKWVKVVENSGWLVDCADISPQQFPSWIKQRLQSRSLRVEPGVVELLAEQLEGNVLAAAQEIDKLKVLASDGAVTLKLVSESLADQARFDVYALVDVCLNGDFVRTLRILQRLKSEGVEAVIVVWALVREIRLLASLSAAIGQGQTKASAFKQYRVWNKREAIVNNALGRLSVDQWYQALEEAAHIDQTVKGQRYSDAGTVWYQIELLCGKLCSIDIVQTGLPSSN